MLSFLIFLLADIPGCSSECQRSQESQKPRVSLSLEKLTLLEDRGPKRNCHMGVTSLPELSLWEQAPASYLSLTLIRYGSCHAQIISNHAVWHCSVLRGWNNPGAPSLPLWMKKQADFQALHIVQPICSSCFRYAQCLVVPRASWYLTSRNGTWFNIPFTVRILFENLENYAVLTGEANLFSI